MVENVAPMPRPMRVMAGASSAARAAVPECATMVASTEQPGHGGEEDQAEDEPGSEAPVAQQRRLDQRHARGPLALGEGGEEDHPGGEGGDRRGSPPVGGLLDQAEQQAQHARREQREPRASMLTARSPMSRGNSLSPAASPATPSTMLIRNIGR